MEKIAKGGNQRAAAGGGRTVRRACEESVSATAVLDRGTGLVIYP
jgi:hypothetical protein